MGRGKIRDNVDFNETATASRLGADSSTDGEEALVFVKATTDKKYKPDTMVKPPKERSVVKQSTSGSGEVHR